MSLYLIALIFVLGVFTTPTLALVASKFVDFEKIYKSLEEQGTIVEKKTPEEIQKENNYSVSFKILRDARIPEQYANIDFNADIRKALNKYLRRKGYFVEDYSVINKRVKSPEKVFCEDRVDYLKKDHPEFSRYEVSEEEWKELLKLYYDELSDVLDKYIEERQRLAWADQSLNISNRIKSSQEKRLLEAAKTPNQWDWQLEALSKQTAGKQSKNKWFSTFSIKEKNTSAVRYSTQESS